MKRRLQYKKNKKALSAVVTTLILVMVSIAGIALVWASTRGVINKQIKSSEACYGIEEKIEFDSKNTCYGKQGNDYYVRFQVNVKDVELQKLIISVSSNSEQQGYTLTNETQDPGVLGLERYPNADADLVVPGINQGFSYKTETFDEIIDNIEITPVIDDYQCGIADSISGLEDCALLVT